MKRYIPNFITSLNLLSGCIAVVMAFSNNFYGVVLCVLLAAVFDFLDGFSARLMKTYSEIGKDLDSLADLISFGFVPGALIYCYLEEILYNNNPYLFIYSILPYSGFLITLFSALRLAKFNNDSRQTNTFIGLPTPACALFWISLIYALDNSVFSVGNLSELNYHVIILSIIIFSFLLISEIRMYSLKIHTISFKDNWIVYLTVIIMTIFIISFNISGIFLGIICYIILSLITSYKFKNHEYKNGLD